MTELNKIFAGNLAQSNPAEPELDERGAAIDVCDVWGQATRSLKSMANSRGLIKRSRLVGIARSLHSQVIKPSHVRPGVEEHTDMLAARLATADWIVHTVSSERKFIGIKGAATLNRFFWGYLERTALFDAYFQLRRSNPLVTPSPAVVAAQATEAGAGLCHVGFTYGSPTLGALFDRARDGSRHRLRGRGKFSVIGINDSYWQVLHKNKAAHAFLALGFDFDLLQQAHAKTSSPPAGLVIIDDEMAARVLAMMTPIADGIDAGPQFIVARNRNQKFRLQLRLARERGFTQKSYGDDPLAWRRRRANLFDAIETCVMRNFVPSEATGSSWGTFEHFHWYLTAVPNDARRNEELFEQHIRPARPDPKFTHD